MTIKIKHLGVIAAILITPPLPVTFPEPVTAQLVKSDSQSQEQVRTAVINEIPKFFNAPTSTPQVREITVVGNYAFVYWSLGEGGGSAIAIKKRDAWQVKLYGDDWGGIERLEKDGIPRNIAQKLLDKAFPEWRQFETASKPALPMEFSFDEGFANITVPDRNTTLSAYGNQLRLYDAHIAKMFEITHFLCHNGAEGSIEWSYQAGGGSINMGDFLVSCQLANDIASAYGLGIPEKTAIQFSQGEEESPIAKNFDVTKFNITDNKIPRWIGFVQKFKPIR